MRLLTTLPLSLSLLAASALADTLGIEVTKAVDCARKTENGDKISVNYKGTLESDGTEFDSSYGRGVPFTFTLGKGQVIQGWDNGLLGMCIGEGRKLTIPPHLAYGNDQNGVIPPGSTLVFETELMGIDGVQPQQAPERPKIEKPGASEVAKPDDEDVETTSTPTPTPSPSPTPEPSVAEKPATTAAAAAEPAKPTATQDSPMESNDTECHLLGPWALIVQSALGLLAVSSLFYKRWRESPRRPLKIWFFDVSKQVVGSVLLHLANVLMSMLSSGSFDVAAQTKATPQYAGNDDEGKQPNPCSFYLLNIAVDTTIGIPILVLFLKVLHRAFLLTPMAKPQESIRSGNYGHPPRATWWLKQCVIYFLGLLGMKLCVFALFQLLPWIAWVGDWALRWTEGNEAIQIAFVMFIFPLIMNALQYWIIDGFIKDPSHGESRGEEGYGAVHGDESDDDDAWLASQRRRHEDDDSDVEANETDPLKEANPTPVPIRRNSGKGNDYDPDTDGHAGSSRDGSKEVR